MASRASHTQLKTATECQATAVCPCTLLPGYITNLHINIRYCKELCHPEVFFTRYHLEVTATSQKRSTYQRIYAILKITPPVNVNSSPHKKKLMTCTQYHCCLLSSQQSLPVQCLLSASKMLSYHPASAACRDIGSLSAAAHTATFFLSSLSSFL